MSAPQLFLIDAHALCYRSFYAIRDLETSTGQATNAVYGFLSTLRKILRDYQPQYLAVCFDTKAKTRRQEKFSEYKIQRPQMPDDLISQIPLIQDAVKAYQLPVFAIEGYEADDVMATIARKMAAKDLDVVIVSDDKDLLQLVTDHVKVFSSRQDKFMARADVETLMGVAPERIPDYIALAGDNIDNIPGVKGIGEVTARKLIQTYGGIEDIFARIDEISSAKLKERLIADQKLAVLSKDLAVLEEVPITFKLEDMRVHEPDPKQLLELYTRLEFKKLASEMMTRVQSGEELKVRDIASIKDAQTLVSRIQENGSFAFLLDGDEVGDDLFVKTRIVLALNGADVFVLDLDNYAWLEPVWTSPQVIKITHDVKRILRVLQPRGFSVANKIFDVMLAGYVVIPGRSVYDINTLAWNYLKAAVGDKDPVFHAASLVYQLHEPLLKELKEKDLLSLFEDLEIPLAAVLAQIENTGVALDVVLLERLSGECHQKMDALKADLFRIAGQEFNVNSPKQLSLILFETLKLPVIKKTKTGFSTDEEVLVRLADQHEFPKLILEYRQLSKLQSTYIDALPKLVDPKTGRLHASFDQTGTETGRLSSNNPNLQNIPIRSELGREIRKAFIPSKGNVILAADYSQIELRVLAHLSGDETLHAAFASGEDIHSFTAAQIFEVAEKDVSWEMRNTAKRVNFGIVYGMSAYGLAKDLDISQLQAQDFIDRYFLRYPNVKVFMDQQIKNCEELGYVSTLLNRRRYIPEIHSKTMAIRQFAQRQAINTPVQGSAADLIKLAMVKVQAQIVERKLASRMIITVHDELVFDVPKDEVVVMGQVVRQQMEQTFSLSVPVTVTVKQGRSWAETQKVEND